MQPACCCGMGLWSKGWRRRLARKNHFSQPPHLQSPSGGRRLPTCLCPPKPQLLPASSQVLQLPGVLERALQETAVSFWVFLTALLTWRAPELGAKFSLTPGLSPSPSQSQSWNHLEQTTFFISGCPTHHVGLALIPMPRPVPFLPALLISKCVHTSQQLCTEMPDIQSPLVTPLGSSGGPDPSPLPSLLFFPYSRL